MENGISIICCCYNSSQRLPQTLKHICQQQVDTNISWEVIIVNNNSSDNTKQVARELLITYECPTSFKIIDETQAGLSFAREKGIEASQFTYIIFCDDDNWLAPHYVERAYQIMEDRKDVGVLGGFGQAECEVTPPKWFAHFPGVYAVGKPKPKSGYIKRGSGFVYGAGMVIRKSAWQQLKASGYQFYLSDRIGKALSSGGDSEICLVMNLLGFQLYFDDKLQYRHYIPKERLQWKYVKKMTFGLGCSYAYIHYLKWILKNTVPEADIWKKQVVYYINYLFSPKLILAFLKARMKKNSWTAVSYPAHLIALKEFVLKKDLFHKNVFQLIQHYKKPKDY